MIYSYYDCWQCLQIYVYFRCAYLNDFYKIKLIRIKSLYGSNMLTILLTVLLALVLVSIIIFFTYACMISHSKLVLVIVSMCIQYMVSLLVLRY